MHQNPLLNQCTINIAEVLDKLASQKGQ